MAHSRAKNTVKAYVHSFGVFASWCRDVGFESMPSSESAVLDFCTWCLYERRPPYRLATVRLALSAVASAHDRAGHPSPISVAVRAFIRNAARDLLERPGGKSALSAGQLRRLCRFLDSGDVIDVRDRAMILLQFAAGWRRSEVASLWLRDVGFERRGLVVRLGASKTDQDGGEGREVGIEHGERELTCPVRALRSWLRVRGDWDGPLFCRVHASGKVLCAGLSGRVFNDRLKRCLDGVGIDSSSYSSHSLRAGMVTAGIERGASETLIMLRTGHKSLATMRRYVRVAQAFRVNPLAGVL